MAKFHVNKNGVPAPCRAEPGNCPLGGDGEHFYTAKDAQEHADKTNEKKHGLLGGFKKLFGGNKPEILSEHRMQYYQEEVDGDAEEKLDNLRYAVGLIEEEDGNVGESEIGKRVETMASYVNYSTKISTDKIYGDILKIIRNESDGEGERYFNKIDSVQGVDSTEGFIPKDQR